MCIKAKATIRGARPSPATQCTAILGGPSFPFPFSLNSFFVVCYYSITYGASPDSAQNSSTISSHLSISYSVGNPPSSKLNSWILTPLF